MEFIRDAVLIFGMGFGVISILIIAYVEIRYPHRHRQMGGKAFR